MAYDYGLLWMYYGLLWCTVAHYFGLLGVPGNYAHQVRRNTLAHFDPYTALHISPFRSCELITFRGPGEIHRPKQRAKILEALFEVYDAVAVYGRWDHNL